MTGIVDFRTAILDENGDPITALNPFPTTGSGGGGGGGGGGGSLLADVLLTDDDSALFVARDNGTAITFFNLNTNAIYTPVGTIKAAGLTDVQLRAAPVPVIDATNEASQQNMITLLTRMINYLNSPQGYDKSLQRQRSTVILESGTVTAVTTVATVTNVTSLNNIDGYNGRMQVLGQNQTAWQACVRARIS